jgi:hypothetical protein
VNLFHWTDAAKHDVRSIDRQNAINILQRLTDYGATGKGDVKQLKGSADFRLRVGDTACASSVSKTAGCESSRSNTAKKRTAKTSTRLGRSHLLRR